MKNFRKKSFSTKFFVKGFSFYVHLDVIECSVIVPCTHRECKKTYPIN